MPIRSGVMPQGVNIRGAVLRSNAQLRRLGAESGGGKLVLLRVLALGTGPILQFESTLPPIPKPLA